MSAGPPVTAIVLAGGRGRRMDSGGTPKHLLPLSGRPLLLRVLDALAESQAEELVVVLREEDQEGARLAAAAGASPVPAEDPEEGRAASVRAGVRAAAPDADLLICLADQPLLEARDFDALIAARAPDAIVYARYAGQRGSPVLFGARYRTELLALAGGEGGRAVIARHPDACVAVDLDPERGLDVDRPGDLARAEQRLPQAGGARYLPPPMERTLSIIKPDAVAQGFIGPILEQIEGHGLKVVAMKLVQLTKERAEGFYAVHRERPFFSSLVEFMTSGPVVVSALEGENAIGRYRELMGKTNPDEADPGTIRKRFATNIERNAVHGSDAPDTARFELDYFFSPEEYVNR